eukprot:scaffold235744_cov37-Prasinocladus_malaysianus.AAC.2
MQWKQNLRSRTDYGLHESTVFIVAALGPLCLCVDRQDGEQQHRIPLTHHQQHLSASIYIIDITTMKGTAVKLVGTNLVADAWVHKGEVDTSLNSIFITIIVYY